MKINKYLSLILLLLILIIFTGCNSLLAPKTIFVTPTTDLAKIQAEKTHLTEKVQDLITERDKLDSVLKTTQAQLAQEQQKSTELTKLIEFLKSQPVSQPAQTVYQSGGTSNSIISSSSNVETVLVNNILGDYKVIIKRTNGDLWMIEYGIGALSLEFYQGRNVLIYSPGLFAGIGSKVLIPERDQQARIWDSEFIGR